MDKTKREIIIIAIFLSISIIASLPSLISNLRKDKTKVTDDDWHISTGSNDELQRPAQG